MMYYVLISEHVGTCMSLELNSWLASFLDVHYTSRKWHSNSEHSSKNWKGYINITLKEVVQKSVFVYKGSWRLNCGSSSVMLKLIFWTITKTFASGKRAAQ